MNDSESKDENNSENQVVNAGEIDNDANIIRLLWTKHSIFQVSTTKRRSCSTRYIVPTIHIAVWSVQRLEP